MFKKNKYFIALTMLMILLASGCSNSIKAQIESQNYEYSVDGFIESVMNQKYDVVDLFLEAGYLEKLNEKTCPLKLAIEARSPFIMKKFIAKGANVNSEANPLAIAAKDKSHHNRLKFTKILLANGADPNLNFEPMVIEIVSQKNDLELLKLLLENEASTETADPLKYALQHKSYAVAEYLMKIGIQTNKLDEILTLALRHESYKQADYLLSLGAKIENLGEVIAKIILENDLELVKLLHKYNYNPKVGLDKIPLSSLYDYNTYFGELQKPTKHNINLYFTDGNWQVIEKRRVTKVSSHLIADQLIEELFKGTSQKGIYSVMPKDTKLLYYKNKDRKIEVIDGCAYVNLSQEFVDNYGGGTFREVMSYYGIVNTLTELPNVKTVQLLVGGKIHPGLSHASMNEPFERAEYWLGSKKE